MPAIPTNPRTLRLPGRIAANELQLIDDLRDKVQSTKKEKVSRVDVIVLAVKYATVGMFPEK